MRVDAKTVNRNSSELSCAFRKSVAPLALCVCAGRENLHMTIVLGQHIDDCPQRPLRTSYKILAVTKRYDCDTSRRASLSSVLCVLLLVLCLLSSITQDTLHLP